VTGHGRVLVVDDQPQVLDMLREIVERMGYEPCTAASVEQAIAAMATVRPHVVFLDLLMPGMSSLEVLAHFREHHGAVPVIVITGNMEQEIARQARAGGAFAVVGKPIDLSALKVVVALAMRLAPRT
jgi:DNA-binding NtrC family response regulator